MLYPQNPTSLPFINTQKDFTVLFREINSEIMHGTIYQLWRPLQYAFCAFFWQCMLELMEDIILSQRQLFPAVSDQLSLQSFFVGCISAFSPRLFRKVAVLCRGKNRFLQSVFPVFLCCWGCFLVCTCLKKGDGPGLLPWFCFFPGLIGHLWKIVHKVTLPGDKFANTRTTKLFVHFRFIFRLRLKWYKMWP